MSSIQGIGAASNATSGVGQADHPSGVAAKEAIEKKADPKLHAMAKEFEAMFVRQILTTAKITGSGKQDAYGGMGVDALATNISSGQGLGLARQIEDTVRRAEHGHSAAPALGSANSSAALPAASALIGNSANSADTAAENAAISAAMPLPSKSTKE